MAKASRVRINLTGKKAAPEPAAPASNAGLDAASDKPRVSRVRINLTGKRKK